MNRGKTYIFGAMIAVPLFYFGGCGKVARIPARFELGESLGTFAVTAGEITQNGGSGNLGYVDPNLTAPDSGAFGLRSGSSAVDHGVMLAALPAFDLSGATRVAGAAIDLGPYESR